MAAVNHAQSQKKILLVGLPAAGKSTTGNFLLRGTEEALNNPVFPMFQGNIGHTTEVTHEHNGEWAVTDTVGMGEVLESQMSAKEAANLIMEFLHRTGGQYSHVAYVVTQAQLAQPTAKRMWKLCRELLRSGESKFVIIVTHSNEEWLRTNFDDLKQRISSSVERQKIIAVNFPPRSTKPAEEIVHVTQRQDSLDRLRLFLDNTHTGYVNIRPTTDANLRSIITKALSILVNGFKGIVTLTASGVTIYTCLSNTLPQDG